MKKKIVIVGASGSGKDYLMGGLISMGMKPCVKWSTRPMRDGEVQNETYHFTDNVEFEQNIINMLVYQTFNIEVNGIPKKWYYGIEMNSFIYSEISILTPNEISSLKKEVRDQCTIIYLNISDNIRRKRIESRNDNSDSVTRRIESDHKDFKDFIDFDLIITDPIFNISEIYNSL